LPVDASTQPHPFDENCFAKVFDTRVFPRVETARKDLGTETNERCSLTKEVMMSSECCRLFKSSAGMAASSAYNRIDKVTSKSEHKLGFSAT